MKYKLSLIIAIIFCMLSFTSCQHVNEDKEAYRLNTAVIKCLDTGDKETIKSMLNEKTRAGENIDEQIDALFDAYEGCWVPDDTESLDMNGSRTSSRFGSVTKIIYPHADIKTDAGKTYYLGIEYYALSDDTRLLGINRISLTDATDRSKDHYPKYVIGSYD